MTDPAGLRASYTRGQLEEADVADTWLPQLRAWFDAAVADPAVLEPNAIQLATADASGQPAVRTVLAKAMVARVSSEETEAYFHSRPRDSQLGAWASPQSEVVASRTALDDLAAAADDRFADSEVPVPPNWGGYRLRPDQVEFWQGRTGRLHDRIRFRRAGENWVRERLAP
jgi:pyridoxamine 5'-phosphate oxidase